MAFNKDNFARLTTSANSNIPVIWGYSTSDATGDIDTAGYFNNVAGDVQVGDVILANTGFYLVSANDGTTVDVNNVTAFTTTDTD